MSKSNSSSCCSEEDVTGNRKIDEQNELSKADFLGWIAAKCKLLRKNSRTVFEFKALETFSELVASILVKTYESAVKCEEMLYRSVVDEMWTKLEEQNQNDRRGVQDITFIWPFVKEFIDEIFSWKERQQQTKKDFFIRRAFQETKNASPPVLITFASPQLIDDEPNSVKALRKRHSAEGQQSPNSSVIFVESVGGGCSNKVAHVTLRNEERRDENEQPKKRRTEKDAEQPKKKANETPIKQEVIVVDDQQDDVSGKGSKEGTVPTKHMQKADKETEKVPQEKEQQHKERKEDEDEDEIYSLSFGNKSMFEPEEETPSNEPEMEDQQLLKSVKMEPEENDPKENEESRKKGEGEDEEMTAGEEDEEGEEQTDEEEGEVTGSDGTDTPPPFPAKTVTRPYSPIRTPAMNESANQSLSNGAEVTQCKSEHWAEQSVQPQLNTFTAFDAAPCSSSFVDDFNKTPKVSPQKRSEFDFFDQPVTALAKPASPAKNEHRKYSKKVKIRKLKEYQDEQRLRHRLAIGQKTLRFADKISTFSFLIDEGNVMSRLTANEKNPFFVTSSTTKFLKKPSKAKNEGQKSRRHLEGQINNDVRDVVTAVKERSKELLKQQNSYADEDDLATARGDRLVRFSRLLLTDSLLQRLDEDVLKNAYVLRSLEHPRNIELFIDKGLNRNANFLRNSSNLVYFEFSYLFVFYGYDQIVHRPNCVPDPSHFLFLLRHWFVETFLTVDDVKEQIPLMKNCEDENHYYYTPPRIVAVTIPEVGEYAREFRVFNEDLRSFVIANSGCFLLLDWAQMVANCSDVNALDSEEKRMQILALELKCEFGVLIK